MGNQNLTVKQRAILDNILSLSDEQLISVIQEFRENGELFIVEPLIEMLFSNRGYSLKEAILELVSDSKNQNAVDIITRSIRNHYGETYSTGLISACWQSNLDFSAHLPLFIDILCDSDYQVSFEAFTVIENSVGNIGKSEIDLYTATIEAKLKDVPVEKQSLLAETILLLESFKRSGSELES